MSGTNIGSDLRDIAADLEAEIATRDERIEQLETDLKETKDELETAVAEIESEMLDAREALEAVKYWMQDVFAGQPMRDPRKIFRIVERALERD